VIPLVLFWEVTMKPEQERAIWMKGPGKDEREGN